MDFLVGKDAPRFTFCLSCDIVLLDIPSFLFSMGVYFQTALLDNVSRNGQIYRLAELVNDLDNEHRRSQQINKQNTNCSPFHSVY